MSSINRPNTILLLNNGTIGTTCYNGLADRDNNEIVLSEICIQKGMNEIVNSIVEEYIHLKYDAADETRKFQNSIITEFTSYMKRNKVFVFTNPN